MPFEVPTLMCVHECMHAYVHTHTWIIKNKINSFFRGHKNGIELEGSGKSWGRSVGGYGQNLLYACVKFSKKSIKFKKDVSTV